jgi:hypothetical protein
VNGALSAVVFSAPNSREPPAYVAAAPAKPVPKKLRRSIADIDALLDFAILVDIKFTLEEI